LRRGDRDILVKERPYARALTARSVSATFSAAEKGDAMGRYEGTLLTRWHSDGREMELTAPFCFIDEAQMKWDVPAGARIDGASIPPILWSITGSPYTGKYRDASVVHDWYCSIRTRRCSATHRMFREAMLVSGVSVPRANLMYAAVKYAGPKWSDMDIRNTSLATGGRWSESPAERKLDQQNFEVPFPSLPDGGPACDRAEDGPSQSYASEAFPSASPDVPPYEGGKLPIPARLPEGEVERFAAVADDILNGTMKVDDIERLFSRGGGPVEGETHLHPFLKGEDPQQ